MHSYRLPQQLMQFRAFTKVLLTSLSVLPGSFIQKPLEIKEKSRTSFSDQIKRNNPQLTHNAGPSVLIHNLLDVDHVRRGEAGVSFL